MDLFCRRTEILQTIYARRRETYETLAFEFNVDISTIGRDVRYLARYYPIRIIQGRGGGVELMEGSHRTNNLFTSEQIRVLRELEKTANVHQREILEQLIDEFGPYVAKKGKKEERK